MAIKRFTFILLTASLLACNFLTSKLAPLTAKLVPLTPAYIPAELSEHCPGNHTGSNSSRSTYAGT